MPQIMNKVLNDAAFENGLSAGKEEAYFGMIEHALEQLGCADWQQGPYHVQLAKLLLDRNNAIQILETLYKQSTTIDWVNFEGFDFTGIIQYHILPNMKNGMPYEGITPNE